MKRLLSVNNYYYGRGGADIVFLQHNDLLKGINWDVVPFSMKHSKNLESDYEQYFPSEIEFGENYSFLKKMSMTTKVIYSFEARARIGALLRKERFDICHCHNIYHHISPSILSKMKMHGIPVVMTLHDLKMACPNYQMMTHDGICERCRGGRLYNVMFHKCVKNSVMLSTLIMIESYLHRLSRIYSKNIDQFIVPSLFYECKLIEWGLDREKIKYIPNYVDTDGSYPNYKPGKRYLYFGRLAKEKGLSTLIQAASLAGAELLIAGVGPEMESLKRQAQHAGCRAEFLGHLTGESLQNIVRSCRATVLPSEWYENAPLSIKESYALGKPVIGANIGGIPELVVDGETGIIFQSGSAEKLAEALIIMTNKKDHEIEKMGKAARQFVALNFSKRNYLEKIINLYESLIN